MDPKGFMSEEDKIKFEENKVKQQPVDPTREGMQPQYGYKPKGPEPTRYGDWEVKGKCVDF